MTVKRQAGVHTHFMVTCGGCMGMFKVCSHDGMIPCFVICPICQIKNLFWEDPDLPNT